MCCNCNAPDADVKCSCLAVYYCGLACQQAHILEHKHACTHLLFKSIKKKGAVISRLQVQGSSDGVASVELMVLEQELARVHGARGKRRGVSPEAAARPLEQTRVRGDSQIGEYAEIWPRMMLRGDTMPGAVSCRNLRLLAR